MKILVTGGCGFIGSALIKTALKKGHKVINIDNLSYAGSTSNLENVLKNENYLFFKENIINGGKIYKIISETKPNAIIHLAAESHVDRSISGPRNFLDTNVIGTFELLESSRKYWYDNNKNKDFRFLHVSTDEVYGSLGSKGKFTELSSYSPNSPYSASKAASDHFVRSWFKTYEFPSIITNCSNNYGPYQFPEKLIPLTIIKAIKSLPIDVYGEGKNVRDWLFVNDHVNAILKVLDKGSSGLTYNIGSNNEYTNIELVKLLCSEIDIKLNRTQKTSNLIQFVKDRPGHDERYAIDYSFLKNSLGWEPQYKFKDSLSETIDWYIKNQYWWEKIITKFNLNKRLGLIEK